MAVVYPFKKYNYKVTVGSLGDMGFLRYPKGTSPTNRLNIGKEIMNPVHQSSSRESSNMAMSH